MHEQNLEANSKVKKFNNIYLILGSLNYKTGELNDLAQNRLDKLLKLIENEKNFGIICTGGFGDNFNNTDIPHGNYLFEYLKDKGVNRKHFIEVAMSRHTVDDAVTSKKIIEKLEFDEIKIITSDFHKERVELIFERVFPDKWRFEVHPAKSDMTEERWEKLTSHEKRSIKQIKENGLYFD